MTRRRLGWAGRYAGFLTIALLALTGSPAAKKRKPLPTPPEGEGLVYVYRRPRVVGKIVYPSIFVNDYSLLGELHNGEYASLAVKEGTVVVTATSPTGGRVADFLAHVGRVSPPSTTGFWASLPGCAGLDWGRLALAPPADVVNCQHNLARLYRQCGVTETTEDLITMRFTTVRVPACYHRLDGSENAFSLLFLAQCASRVKFEVEAGKSYYVEWSVSLRKGTRKGLRKTPAPGLPRPWGQGGGNAIVGANFKLVDEDKGAKAIAKSKPAEER